MIKYESEIKTISSSEEVVFNMLSDLNNLKNIGQIDAIREKVKSITFDTDSIRVEIEMLGQVGFKIIEREPNKTIKFESENSPVGITMWIQLKQVAAVDTRMKITVKADIPTMLKLMIDKKLKEGVDLMAGALADALNAKLMNDLHSNVV
ncbi:MAG: SRPBCC family protein [Prevotellaceae bacterium]|jgi:carbon monoxide dehydrogenase subunit G|nr:SRPBCC family protein [Prevotellaceae bacterium]